MTVTPANKPAPFTPAVFKDGIHTCICIDRAAKAVKFIPMSTLDVETATPREFDAAWVAYHEYPVKRAAERYLLATQYRTIPAKAHEHLSKIVAQAAGYPTFESLNSTKPEGKSEMASKKPANGLSAVVDNAKAVARNRRATDKTVAAGKPKAAPAKTKPEAKAAAPAKTKAEATPKAAKAPDTTKYKIGDLSSVKRGFLAEYVEKAQALKQFTRDALEAEFGGRQGHTEAQKMGTYFPYAVSKGIFVAAK